MASRSEPHDTDFPVVTELRCGRCFKKLGQADITAFQGRIELLCTRRSSKETCRTMNIYEGVAGRLRHEFERVADGGTA